MLFIVFHITSWYRATRSLTYDNLIVIQPNSHTHALSAFLSQPPHGTGKKSSTHCSLSPFISMHHGPRPIFLFSFLPPRGTEQKSPTHCSVGRRPNFFFSRHLMTKSKSHQHTALPVLDRIFVFSTPLRGTAKVCDSPLHRFETETFF